VADLDLNVLAGSLDSALQFVGEHHRRQFALRVGVPRGVLLIEVEILELNFLQPHFIRVATDDHDAPPRFFDPLEEQSTQVLDEGQWERFLEPLRSQDWAVYLQPPPSTHASAENLLKYLARYVTGGPISDGRLISHENGQVTFWARDKSKTGNRVPVRLSGAEFVRRWSLHISM